MTVKRSFDMTMKRSFDMTMKRSFDMTDTIKTKKFCQTFVAWQNKVSTFIYES